MVEKQKVSISLLHHLEEKAPWPMNTNIPFSLTQIFLCYRDSYPDDCINSFFYLSSFVLIQVYKQHSGDNLVFFVGLAMTKNYAHCKWINQHSGLYSSCYEWIYLVWVPRKSSTLGVQQKDRLEDKILEWVDHRYSSPAVLCNWYLSLSSFETANLPDAELPFPVITLGFSGKGSPLPHCSPPEKWTKAHFAFDTQFWFGIWGTPII